MHCAKCGAEVQQHWSHCAYCGTPIEPDLYGGLPPDARLQPPAAPADRWRRMVAFLIDGPIIWIVGFPIGLLVVMTDPYYATHQGEINEVMRGSAILAAILYFWVAHAIWGQTLGKRLMRIKVVRANGRPPGFGWGIIRVLVMFALATLWITWWPMLGEERRAIHDYAAGTWVIQAHRPAKTEGGETAVQGE